MADPTHPHPGERTWYRLRVVLVVDGPDEAYVIAGDGPAYLHLVEMWSRRTEEWPFLEAGVDLPEEPGCYFLEVSLYEDYGIDTPSGPAEYGAMHAALTVRPATDEERLGRFAEPLPSICGECGRLPAASPCEHCEAERRAWDEMVAGGAGHL